MCNGRPFRTAQSQAEGYRSLASMRLSAQESRDLELIVFERVIHRRGATVLVEALRGRPRGDRSLGIFRDGLGARFGRTRQRRHRLGPRPLRPCPPPPRRAPPPPRPSPLPPPPPPP